MFQKLVIKDNIKLVFIKKEIVYCQDSGPNFYLKFANHRISWIQNTN